MHINDIKVLYPKAELDEQIIAVMANQPNQKVTVIEGTMRNYSDVNKEVYDYVVCIQDYENIILQDQFVRCWI